jgi:hypothetical protein
VVTARTLNDLLTYIGQDEEYKETLWEAVRASDGGLVLPALDGVAA